MLVLLATHIKLAFKVEDKGGEGIEVRYYFLLTLNINQWNIDILNNLCIERRYSCFSYFRCNFTFLLFEVTKNIFGQ